MPTLMSNNGDHTHHIRANIRELEKMIEEYDRHARDLHLQNHQHKDQLMAQIARDKGIIEQHLTNERKRLNSISVQSHHTPTQYNVQQVNVAVHGQQTYIAQIKEIERVVEELQKIISELKRDLSISNESLRRITDERDKLLKDLDAVYAALNKVEREFDQIIKIEKKQREHLESISQMLRSSGVGEWNVHDLDTLKQKFKLTIDTSTQAQHLAIQYETDKKTLEADKTRLEADIHRLQLGENQLLVINSQLGDHIKQLKKEQDDAEKKMNILRGESENWAYKTKQYQDAQKLQLQKTKEKHWFPFGRGLR